MILENKSTVQKVSRDAKYHKECLAFEINFGRRIEEFRNKCQNTDNLWLYDEIIQTTVHNVLYHKEQIRKLRRGDYEEKDLVGL